MCVDEMICNVVIVQFVVFGLVRRILELNILNTCVLMILENKLLQENEQYASATEYDKTLQTAFRSAEWHEAQFKIASKLYSTEATRNKHLYVCYD